MSAGDDKLPPLPELIDLTGRVAVVTGAAQGFGFACARRLAQAGASVVLGDRRRDRLEPAVDRLRAAGLTVTGRDGDVACEEDVDALMETAVTAFGRLDVLVNNAGNMYRSAVADFDEAELLGVFHSNVVGAMMLTSAAVDHLAAASGAVIFIGSVHSQRAFPGASPYAATKGAVETLTGVLAAELGPQGVRVSCVRPGGVFTDLNQRAGLFDDATALARLEGLAPAHALGRVGTTSEIAEAVEYLARAEWTTGAVMTVDGGLSLGVTNA